MIGSGSSRGPAEKVAGESGFWRPSWGLPRVLRSRAGPAGGWPRLAGHRWERAASFTLMELLVVLVILSLIAALCWPALSRVRAQSRQAVCANHLRAIGVGAMLYADAWGGALPLGIHSSLGDLYGGSSFNTLWSSWDSLSSWYYYGNLIPLGYVRAKQFYCPGGSRWYPYTRFPGDFQARRIGQDNQDARSSYYQRGTEEGAPWRVDAPAILALLADPYGVAAAGGQRMASHDAGLNVLYVDGSVTFVSAPGNLGFDGDDAAGWSMLDRGRIP